MTDPVRSPSTDNAPVEHLWQTSVSPRGVCLNCGITKRAAAWFGWMACRGKVVLTEPAPKPESEAPQGNGTFAAPKDCLGLHCWHIRPEYDDHLSKVCCECLHAEASTWVADIPKAVQVAIAIVNDSKHSHETWASYYRSIDAAPDFESREKLGNRRHQEWCIASYDALLKLLTPVGAVPVSVTPQPENEPHSPDCECRVCWPELYTAKAEGSPSEAERLARKLLDEPRRDLLDDGAIRCPHCWREPCACGVPSVYQEASEQLRAEAAALLRSLSRELEEAKTGNERDLASFAGELERYQQRNKRNKELSRQLEEERALTRKLAEDCHEMERHEQVLRDDNEKACADRFTLRTQLEEARTERQQLVAALSEAARCVEGRPTRSPFVAVEEWRLLLSNWSQP